MWSLLLGSMVRAIVLFLLFLLFLDLRDFCPQNTTETMVIKGSTFAILPLPVDELVGAGGTTQVWLTLKEFADRSKIEPTFTHQETSLQAASQRSESTYKPTRATHASILIEVGLQGADRVRKPLKQWP